jgi:hypothetical protein
MTVSFIGGGNQSTRRKPLTYRKSTNKQKLGFILIVISTSIKIFNMKTNDTFWILDSCALGQAWFQLIKWNGQHQTVITMQSVSIISNVSSGEVYSIQHYVIKFVSDLRYVSGVLITISMKPNFCLFVNYWKMCVPCYHIINVHQIKINPF